MDKKELHSFMEELKKVFDVVRLIDVNEHHVFHLDQHKDNACCFGVWNKNERCTNCISARTMIRKERMTKFEFIDDDAYLVMTQYIELDGKPLILEMVAKIDDNVLFGAFSQHEFAHAIEHFNRKLYRDTLTGAYNRQYYNDQMKGFTNINGFAVLDVDDFKNINDTFGHHAGDQALRAIVSTTLRQMRKSDRMIRYGGDEFLLLFQDIEKDTFESTLHKIQDAICQIKIQDYPDLHISVSIGGIFGKGSLDKMLLEADKVLYEAKKEKPQILVFPFTEQVIK